MFFAIALVTLGFLIYVLNDYKLSFWRKRGFIQLSPKFLVGDLGRVFRKQITLGGFFESLYNENKQHGLCGVYFSYMPAVLVTDPLLIQRVFITDFAKFHDRPVPFNLSNDKLQAHLFHLPGQQWRDLRVKLSPTFTSGKLKGMFPIIKTCGETLSDYMKKSVERGENVFEFRDLMARYNTNIISSVAFGIDNDCINEPDHLFRRMGTKMFTPNLRMNFGIFLSMFAPWVYHYTSFKFTDPEVEDFMYSIVKQNVDYRAANNFSRNDFMQYLIQLKDEGYVSVDAKDNGEVKKISIDDVTAQAFLFFQAGYETSSSTLSLCLYELSKHPEVQAKIHEEIDSALRKSGDDGISYDILQELKYMEWCIDETLRKYPILPLLFRECSEDYKVPDTELVIPKGTGVMIPVLGLQRDPAIYENPMEFKPERFSKSSHGAGDAKGLFYLPFGDGPRNCIGMRLGKLTAKLGLMTVLANYTVELDDKSMMGKEIEFDKTQLLLIPAKSFKLKIVPRLRK